MGLALFLIIGNFTWSLTLCILMESSFWFLDKKLEIVGCTYLGVSGYNFQKNIVFFCLFTISVDPNEMLH